MRPTFVIYHNITTYYNISIFLTVPGKVDGADPVRFLYQQFCCKRDGREASVSAKAVEDDHGAFDTLGRMPGPQRKLKSAALHNAALRRCRRQFPAHCCTRCRACTRLQFFEYTILFRSSSLWSHNGFWKPSPFIWKKFLQLT